MARAHVPAAPSGTFTVVLLAFVIAILHFAREILIPFALAVLLAFLLGPLVTRMERWFGRVAASLLVVLTLLGLFGVFGWIASGQLIDLAAKLPEYKGNIQKKVQALRGTGRGPLEKASEAFEEIESQLDNPVATPMPTTLPDKGSAPAKPGTRAKSLANAAEPRSGSILRAGDSDEQAMPVRVVERQRTSVELLQAVLGPLLEPFAKTMLVLILVLFMLVQQQELRDRLILLIGRGRVGSTTQAFHDAAKRVSRYLWMQLVVNVTYGIPVAIGLYFIGVPNALLWGLLATVLRFIPYVGAWMAASMPIALSMAVFDTWEGPMMTIGLLVVLELLSNNVMEPWLYGSSTGVSSLAIILSGVFWAWLWGPVGLILATPLTVCLAVMGRHVPQLEFLSILLSDESVLPPEAHVYHRLLAKDPEAALEVAEKHMQEHSLLETFDEVLLPALALAELDADRGVLDAEKQAAVHQGLKEMIEELSDRDTEQADLESRATVLCLPAKDQADTLAGAMLSEVLSKTGVKVVNVTQETLASEMLELVAEHEAQTVCISVVPPVTISHARYLGKRLRARFPELRIFVGLWTAEPVSQKTQERLLSAGIDGIASTVAQAVAQIR